MGTLVSYCGERQFPLMETLVPYHGNCRFYQWELPFLLMGTGVSTYGEQINLKRQIGYSTLLSPFNPLSDSSFPEDSFSLFSSSSSSAKGSGRRGPCPMNASAQRVPAIAPLRCPSQEVVTLANCGNMFHTNPP